jgi:putative transposase
MDRALKGERGGQAMKRKQFTPEKIIGMLRQAEVELAQGKRIGEVCRALGISEQSYYRWRSEYGGLKLEQARRMKGLEKENGRLKKAVAELTLDKQILKEALEGNF